jgi:O-antigen/teichoic acid export membrane protein
MSGITAQAAIVMLGRVFVRALQFLTFIILARHLTPEEFGWFGIVTSAIAMSATIGSLGLRQSLALKVGQGAMTACSGISTILIAWVPLSLIASISVVYVYVSEIPKVEFYFISAILAAGTSLSMLLLKLQGVFLGQGRIREFSYSDVLPNTAPH